MITNDDLFSLIAMIKKSNISLQSILFKGGIVITPKEIKKMGNIPSINSLKIYHPSFNKYVSSLASNKNLYELDLSRSLDESGFNELRSSSVKHLIVQQCELKDPFKSDKEKRFPNLISLNLSDNQIMDNGARNILQN